MKIQRLGDFILSFSRSVLKNKVPISDISCYIAAEMHSVPLPAVDQHILEYDAVELGRVFLLSLQIECVPA